MGSKFCPTLNIPLQIDIGFSNQQKRQNFSKSGHAACWRDTSLEVGDGSTYYFLYTNLLFSVYESIIFYLIYQSILLYLSVYLIDTDRGGGLVLFLFFYFYSFILRLSQFVSSSPSSQKTSCCVEKKINLFSGRKIPCRLTLARRVLEAITGLCFRAQHRPLF